jgi:hypothetical protein
MHRLRHLSRPAWLTTGLLIGAIVVPAVAAGAAATVVSITGPSGNTAYVSPANQLRAVEMDASKLVHLRASPSSDSCVNIDSPAPSRGLVIKQINVDAATVSDPADAYADVFAGPDCSGAAGVGSVDLTERGAFTLELGTGIALPPGVELSLYSNHAELIVDAFGYSVPGASFPSTAAALRQLGPTGPARPTTKAH